MGGLFSTKKPKVKEAPPAPERTNTQVQERAEENRRAYTNTGSASTLLTSGLGATDPMQSAAVKLLGGVGGV